MIKILIADDHAIVRRGLAQIISEITDMTVLDEAENGQEVLDKLTIHKVDVLLLDINMPGRSGVEILKEVKKDYSSTAVLVLTIYPEEQYAFRVLKSGASGYLTKESAPMELVTAIRKVSQGKKYVSASLAEKLAVYLEEGEDKPPHNKLSDREYEVMLLLASGKTVKKIAEELILSIKTISTYRHRILEKMKMNTNADLTQFAIRNKLIE
jgi:DNA-binding NarL/FixJ family response regulator